MTILTVFVAALFVRPTSQSVFETFYFEKDLLLRGFLSRCRGSVVASYLVPRPLIGLPLVLFLLFSLELLLVWFFSRKLLQLSLCEHREEVSASQYLSQLVFRLFEFQHCHSGFFLLILNSSNSFQRNCPFQ